jgi:hypothetical protein
LIKIVNTKILNGIINSSSAFITKKINLTSQLVPVYPGGQVQTSTAKANL